MFGLFFFNRDGSRSVKFGQHLLLELFASGLGSVSVLCQMAGEVFRSAHNPVMQRQPAVHNTAAASQRCVIPVCHLTVENALCSYSCFFTRFASRQLCPVMSLGRKTFSMLDSCWMFSDCTAGTLAHLKSRLVMQPVMLLISMQFTVQCFIKTRIAFFSKDAHELFHVLTSSLEEERDHHPKVTHLFDMQSLEVSNHPLPAKPPNLKMNTHLSCMLPRWSFCDKNVLRLVSALCLFINFFKIFFYQSLPDQDQKTMACISRGKVTISNRRL